MYEILNSFTQKPILKFQQKLINFENPKIFQKPQNVGFKTWNACKWEKRDLPSEEKKLEKAWRTLGNEIWSERESFGRWKDKSI